MLDIGLASQSATPKEEIDVQSSRIIGRARRLSGFKELDIVLQVRQANAFKGDGIRADL